MNATTVLRRPAAAKSKRFLSRSLAAQHLLRALAPAGGTQVPRTALQNGLVEFDLARPKVQPHVRDVKVTNGGL
jgi:hypothetical protein